MAETGDVNVNVNVNVRGKVVVGVQAANVLWQDGAEDGDVY
jgi:hypothetical protein